MDEYLIKAREKLGTLDYVIYKCSFNMRPEMFDGLRATIVKDLTLFPWIITTDILWSNRGDGEFLLNLIQRDQLKSLALHDLVRMQSIPLPLEWKSDVWWWNDGPQVISDVSFVCRRIGKY